MMSPYRERYRRELDELKDLTADLAKQISQELEVRVRRWK